MNVVDFCERDTVTVEQDESLADAAKLMRQYHTGYVVVAEKKKKKLFPLGIVTDRDVVIEVVATELDPQTITVGDIMQQSLFVVHDDVDMMKALAMMTAKGVRRLPVVNQKGELVGVVSLENLLVKATEVFGGFAKLLKKERDNELKHRP